MDTEDASLEKLRIAAAALGDRTRLALLRFLLARPHRVGELVDALGLPQPLVSHHLAVLVAAGWAQKDGNGKRSAYRLAPTDREPLVTLQRLLAALNGASATAPAVAKSGSEAADPSDLPRPQSRDLLEDYLL